MDLVTGLCGGLHRSLSCLTLSRLCGRCHPKSRPDEVVDEVDELVIEVSAVGFKLECAVMVGLWVFLWWFAVNLRWIAVVGLHSAVGF